MSEVEASEVEADKSLHFEHSGNLINWLKINNVSFVFSSYITHKVYTVGVDPNDKLSIWFTCFERPTGITIVGDDAYIVTKNSLKHFHNNNKMEDGFNCNFSPRTSYNLGEIDAHDIIIDKDNKVLFCNTKFSCISSISDKHNFTVEYIPPWITKLACEDRCHLNGICTDSDGTVRYVTSVCDSDVHDGWRKRRGEEDGFVYDIIENCVVCSNLTMPHSPRMYMNKLWVLNSGKGEFGWINAGTFIPITFIPGFIRGLDFVGKYAIIGSSLDRHERRFMGLLLEKILIEKKIEARCGIYIVDITNGSIIATLTSESVRELYDVKFIKNVTRPRFLDISHDISHNVHRFEDKTVVKTV